MVNLDYDGARNLLDWSTVQSSTVRLCLQGNERKVPALARAARVSDIIGSLMAVGL